MPSLRRSLVPAAVAVTALSSSTSAFVVDPISLRSASSATTTATSLNVVPPRRGSDFMIRGAGANGNDSPSRRQYTSIEEDIEILSEPAPPMVNGGIPPPPSSEIVPPTAPALPLEAQPPMTVAEKKARADKGQPVKTVAVVSTKDDAPAAKPDEKKNSALQNVKLSLLETPKEAFDMLAAGGEAKAKACKTKTLASSLLGGMYVGMGGMLSLAISGNMPGVAAANPGLVKFFFAALFPVNLFVCLLAGGQLFTGNTAALFAAFCEKKCKLRDVLRSWTLSYMGNMVGCAGFAFLCHYCGVLTGGASDMAAGLLKAKTSMAVGPIMVKAFFCNWLVCLAVFLSSQARDMTGKYLGIFLPISAFVSIGFEHSVANMFLLPAGLLSQGVAGGVTLGTALMKNLVPVTIGNALSGSLLVGAMFSFLFGRLGDKVDAFKARGKEAQAMAKANKERVRKWTYFANAI